MQSIGGNSAISSGELAAALAAAGKEARLRLLALLMASREPLCVCELAAGLGLPEYETSRHLAALRRGGLVSCRRDGLWAYYGLIDGPLIQALRRLMTPQDEDLVRLHSRLSQRVAGRCVVGPIAPALEGSSLRRRTVIRSDGPPDRRDTEHEAKERR
jgi:ArsR family transcriptional regulator